MTRVTVVIPAYQAEAVVDAALGSVAAQTRPPDEVILVDDGSTDATSARARKWETLLPLVNIRLEENIGSGLGAGAARAVGIDASSGDVIALLDVDDLFLPDHLEVMLAAHEEHGGLITANHHLWVPGRALGRRSASELVPVPAPVDQPSTILAENFVFIGSLFSRWLYDRAGGFRSIRCEDWDLWIRMIRAGARVHMPAAVTMLYRQAPTSVSGTDKLLIGDIDLLEELRAEATADEVDILDRALRRRYAKQRFLDGIQLADSGDLREAREAWIDAVRLDPSLRRNLSRLNGRVAVRAAACVVAPRTMLRLRSQRQGSAEFVAGSGTTWGRTS